MGRPRAKDPRRNVLSVKLTDDEYAKLLQRVTTAGECSLSAFVRLAITGTEQDLIGEILGERSKKNPNFDKLVKKALGKR